MLELLSGAAQWQEFDKSIRGVNRFFPIDSARLDSFLNEAWERTYHVAKDQVMYRARIMPVGLHESTEPLPASQMGAPPADICSGGRLNPPGIPYLYVADELETAIAEVRPWRDATVTVASLRVLRGVRLVDLRMSGADRGGPNGIFYWCGMMATRPVHLEDRDRYLGTQYLAEALKSVGHAGVIYNSAQGSGHNCALFDPHLARVEGTSLRMVHSLKYATSEVTSAISSS